jgi:hypothetical protein
MKKSFHKEIEKNIALMKKDSDLHEAYIQCDISRKSKNGENKRNLKRRLSDFIFEEINVKPSKKAGRSYSNKSHSLSELHHFKTSHK